MTNCLSVGFRSKLELKGRNNQWESLDLWIWKVFLRENVPFFRLFEAKIDFWMKKVRTVGKWNVFIKSFHYSLTQKVDCLLLNNIFFPIDHNKKHHKNISQSINFPPKQLTFYLLSFSSHLPLPFPLLMLFYFKVHRQKTIYRHLIANSSISK